VNISISHHQGRVPVAVIRLEGQMDGQNFHELIAKARELFEAGSRDLLLDLGGLTYISSAGLVALHAVALLLRGDSPPDPEQGWAALRSMDRARDAGRQEHVKLLNPRPEITSVLDMVGLSAFFETFTDLDQAVQSFG
jgi:anti-anti-sigma regulatory factor